MSVSVGIMASKISLYLMMFVLILFYYSRTFALPCQVWTVLLRYSSEAKVPVPPLL